MSTQEDAAARFQAEQDALVEAAKMFGEEATFARDTAGLKVFIYGVQGTWKTTFAGCFPKPLFLSISTEGGDLSLAHLPQLYGRPVPPHVRVTSTDEMEKIVLKLSAKAKSGQLPFRTIVVDSITYYLEMWISEVVAEKQKKLRAWDQAGRQTKCPHPEGAIMSKREWGLLDAHMMKFIVPSLHNLGTNVVWTALAKEVYDKSAGENAEPTVREIVPLLSGRLARLLPSSCDVIIYAEQGSVWDAKSRSLCARPKYWVAPTAKTPLVRHRFGPHAFPKGRITCPYLGDDYSTYFGLEAAVGDAIVR